MRVTWWLTSHEDYCFWELWSVQFSEQCYEYAIKPRTKMCLCSGIFVRIVVSAHGFIARRLDQHLRRLSFSGWINGKPLIQPAREVPLSESWFRKMDVWTSRIVRRFLSLISRTLFLIPMPTSINYYKIIKFLEMQHKSFTFIQFYLSKNKRKCG